jgi:hypothetical protein
MNQHEIGSIHDIEVTRHSFKTLLAINPNYFGSFPELGWEPQELKQNDTAYEELDCVSYSPARDRLEATVSIKRPFGYAGGQCTKGSFEYVRFYVDYGNGWNDVGVSAINVHDIPVGSDCEKQPTHPLSYVCGISLNPHRNTCKHPVLPKVRAILSWNFIPPANQPDWIPAWGNTHDCRAQIAPRRWFFDDLADLLTEKQFAQIPDYVLKQPPVPGPDPTPLAPLSLEGLVSQYKGTDVPPHRFALHSLMTAASNPFVTASELSAASLSAKNLGIDLAGILKQLEDTSGDTRYEELECLGLDDGTRSLVATFNVKQQSGYSGPPCSAGSVEYVSFWADWNDECKWTYLGTVSTVVHDYVELKDEICYAAILPVDLDALRGNCETPKIGKVRAVLSWNSTPSDSDPDALPIWGNRLDRHVQIQPGPGYDGKAGFTRVGGVAANKVNLASGLTNPGAVLRWLTLPLPAECPFAGTVELCGPNDPALAGHNYRIRANNIDHPSSQLLTSSFSAVNSDADQVTVTPDPVTGWTPWPTWMSNCDGILGVHNPGGDDRWDYVLELDIAGNGVASARVQMDNTLKSTIDILDTTNAGDLELQTAGLCKVPHGPLNGRFVARDRHFWSWSLGLLGGPGGPIPPTPLSFGIPGFSTGTETPFGGVSFTMDLSNPLLAPCGYVVQLAITDRAIVNSVTRGRTVTIERGICLE